MAEATDKAGTCATRIIQRLAYEGKDALPGHLDLKGFSVTLHLDGV